MMELEYLAEIKNIETDEVYASMTQIGEGPYQTHIEGMGEPYDGEFDEVLTRVNYTADSGAKINFSTDPSGLAANHSYAKIVHKIDVTDLNMETFDARGPVYGHLTVETDYSGENDRTLHMKPIFDILASVSGGMIESIAQRTDVMDFIGDFSDEVMGLYNTAIESGNPEDSIVLAQKLDAIMSEAHIASMDIQWHEDGNAKGLRFTEDH